MSKEHTNINNPIKYQNRDSKEEEQNKRPKPSPCVLSFRALLRVNKCKLVRKHLEIAQRDHKSRVSDVKSSHNNKYRQVVKMQGDVVANIWIPWTEDDE